MKRKYISNNHVREYANHSERSHNIDWREDEWTRRQTGEPPVPNLRADWGRIYSYQTVPLTTERKWELPSAETNRNHDYTRDNYQATESDEGISKLRSERGEEEEPNRTLGLGGTYLYRTAPLAIQRDWDHILSTDTTRRYETTSEYCRRSERDNSVKKRESGPDSGLPGAYNDHLRKRLSGAAYKWYRRYLKNGRSPEEAMKLSLDRPTAVRRDNSEVTHAPRSCFQKEEELSKPCDYRSSGKPARDPITRADTGSTRKTYLGNGSDEIRSPAIPNSEQTEAFKELLRKGGEACKWYLEYLNRGHSQEEARQLTLNRSREIASPQQISSRAHLQLTPRISLEKGEYGSKPDQYKSPAKSAREPISSADTSSRLDSIKGIYPEVKKKRKGLSGSETKWYVRFLKAGHSPEKATKLVKDRPRIPPYQQQHPMKNNSQQKQLNPCPKNFNEGGNAQAPSTHEKNNSLTDNCIKVAILPVDYPKVLLTREQQTDVESALVDAIIKAEAQYEGTLVFENIFFCDGYINLICANTQALDWVVQQTSCLPLCHKLKAVIGKDLPDCQIITILFPSSGGLEGKALLRLLQMQNKGLSTENWHILCEKNDSKANRQLVKAVIDELSAETISNRDHNLNFRFGTLAIYGLKNGKISREKFAEEAVSSSDSAVILQESKGMEKQDASTPFNSSANQIEDKTDTEDLTPLSSAESKRETIPLAEEEILHIKSESTSHILRN